MKANPKSVRSLLPPLQAGVDFECSTYCWCTSTSSLLSLSWDAIGCCKRTTNVTVVAVAVVVHQIQWPRKTMWN